MKNYASLVLLWILLTSYHGFARNDTIVFSAQGGFYEETFELELFNYYPQNHIRYTLNGNRPTVNSPIYTEPLTLDESLYSNSNIYTIVNCPEDDFYLPDSVQHCIVIRAALFDENDSCISPVTTNSYFIHALGCDTHGLPVVSLCADSLDLFDYETGIFVPGINYDTLKPNFTGNYFMRGREWERLSNIEFYELDNDGINQQVGLRTHGNSARRKAQKGMKIYARREYGKKRIKHDFFETTPINSFKHLCLKPFVGAWNGSGCKDYITSCMAQHVDVERLASRPCVLFLNGEYWGVYYVSEKPDEHFLEDHFDVDIEEVNIINIWKELECGSSDNYLALRAWMDQANLADDEQYAYAEEHIDIANFIDYYVLELFTANIDWPATNTRMWQLGDGKWRWIFYDGDACLEALTFDVFANATYEGDGSYPSSRRATLFFRKLLENEHFTEQFAHRYNELVSTMFSYQNTQPYFESIKQKLQGEIPNQIERFNVPANYLTWECYCMAVIDRFLRERPNMSIVELNYFLAVGEMQVHDLQCYPNPFTNEVHIEMVAEHYGATEINIYDMMGRRVFAQPYMLIKGENHLVIGPNLPSGLYLLKVGPYSQRILRY